MTTRKHQVLFVPALSAFFLPLGCATETDGSFGAREQGIIFGGVDDRVSYDALTDLRVRRWADATAAIFAPDKVSCNGSICELSLEPLVSGTTETEGELPLCEGEPDRGRLKGADCSAFLVGPDLMATAGHCVDACEDLRFVFGFTEAGEPETSVPQSDVYGCSEIIRRYGAASQNADLAVVRLDRAVSASRRPFPIARGDAPAVGTPLVMLGHPLGLPMTYTPNGEARPPEDRPWQRFGTTLDGFQGNSGSPVVNPLTGVAEGIYASRPMEHFVARDDGNGGRCATLSHCDDVQGCDTGAQLFTEATRNSRISRYVPELEPECFSDADCVWSFSSSCVVGSCNEHSQCEFDNSSCDCLSDSQCDDQDPCTEDICFVSTYSCIHPATECQEGCTEENAVDMGSPGQNTTVASDGCIRVRDDYPSWWGSSRTMLLQSSGASGYPIPYTWHNACGGGGSGVFSGNWQGELLHQVNAACATVIDLGGEEDQSVSLRYYAQ